jgi:TrmH family RNA methyltransferase
VAFDIVSTANPRVKRLIRLGQRRHRDEERVFLVEGSRLLERALAAGLEPVEIYGDGSVPVGGHQVTTVHPDVLDRVSYRSHSEGLVAVFPQFPSDLRRVEPRDQALVLVAESLEKPGNLGAMLRTADAVGADAVISLSAGIDRFNPNLLRASTGACFTVPFAETDLGGLSAWLASHEISLVAADPPAPLRLWDADLTGPVALMVGGEDRGLTAPARDLADLTVSIPMAGSAVDSLNASISMALLAYEARRQRETARPHP